MEGPGIISSDMGAAWRGLHRGVLKLLKQSGQQWPEWGRQPCSAHLDGLVSVQWAGGFPAPGFAVGCKCPTLLRCFGRLYHCPCHVVPVIWDRRKWEIDSEKQMTGNFHSPLLLPLNLSDKLCHQKNTALGTSQEREVSAVLVNISWSLGKGAKYPYP